MKMKQIKKFGKRFIKDNEPMVNEARELLLDFIFALERENKISKCGTADGSPMMPEFPDLD